MSETPLSAVILAAGLGKRMRSRTPKVLHQICGRAMLDLVVDACQAAGLERPIAVVSPGQPEVAAHLDGRCELVFQAEPAGSGDALARVPADRLGAGDVLVLNGDLPLIRAGSLLRIVEAHRASGARATLASAIDPNRRAGRLMRGPDGRLERIVEDADASAQERSLAEINVGAYCFGGAGLVRALARLRPDNAAGELYLTDLIGHLRPVQVVRLDDPTEAIGVNDRADLALAERALQDRLLGELMRSGVTVRDPASTFVEVGVTVGPDSVLEPFTILRGRTAIGAGCRIGPHTEINDSRLGEGVRVAHSWLDGAELAAGSDCGPFSKLRPGARIGERVHIGSFAELVRSSVGADSAVPHFAYLGDATVGAGVNVGAGTVTANFDGARKNPTVIEDGAFLGVDTMLRAPVRVGRGARTGAGAVVTRDVPAHSTAVGMPARSLRRRRPGQGGGSSQATDGGQE